MLIGATADGKKELLGIADGYRESEESWKELLLDLKRRGLEIDPKLVTGMGLWASGKRCRRCLGQPAHKEPEHRVYFRGVDLSEDAAAVKQRN